MGSSRDIAIGPVAVVSLLLGTLLQNEIDHTTHPAEYLRLAFTATFFAGITQATLGILRSLYLSDLNFLPLKVNLHSMWGKKLFCFLNSLFVSPDWVS